ncbi:MAG: ribosome-binding factor A [bacterium]|nr:ribosome-binding factor A [bacterium]
MEDNHRKERANAIIIQAASTFIGRESTNQSLITVTRGDYSKDSRSLTLFISVLPAEQEAPALSFLNRHKHDLFEFIKKTTSLDFIPKIVFIIDAGEKNRQRMDELVNEDKKLAQ